MKKLIALLSLVLITGCSAKPVDKSYCTTKELESYVKVKPYVIIEVLDGLWVNALHGSYGNSAGWVGKKIKKSELKQFHRETCKDAKAGGNGFDTWKKFDLGYWNSEEAHAIGLERLFDEERKKVRGFMEDHIQALEIDEERY